MRTERPISKARITAVAGAVVMAVIAVWFFVDSSRRFRLFDEWVAAEPTRFTADLSRPGSTDAPFLQTCEISHAQVILLRVADASETPQVLLAGLRGRAHLLDAAGGGPGGTCPDGARPL